MALGLLLGLSRILGLPPSPVLFLGGVATALLPVPLPPLRTHPEVVLSLLLPPLLYASVVALSVDLLRHALVRGVVGGAVLVVVIALSVAEAAAWLLPGLDPVACLLIGVCASIGDTRVPQETGHARHLPRALTDAYSGQAVSARLIVVSLYMLVRGAVGGPPPDLAAALLRLGTDLLGGGLTGVAVGLLAVELRRRIGAATVEVAISFATPFLGTALATAAGLSVAVVVVVAALTVSARSVDRRTGEAISSPEARLVSRHVWSEAELMLSAALYFLIGRAMPEALGALGHYDWTRLVLVAAALVALIIAMQFGLALLAIVMPWSPQVPGEDGRPAGPLRVAAVGTWSAHRSAIALGLALAVPAAMPDGQPYAPRELVLALVALMVLLSSVVQGATLPAMLAWARLGGAEEKEREAELAHAEAAAAEERAGDDPDRAAAEGRRVLTRLREQDAIGDAALNEAEGAVAARAQAEKESR